MTRCRVVLFRTPPLNDPTLSPTAFANPTNDHETVHREQRAPESFQRKDKKRISRLPLQTPFAEHTSASTVQGKIPATPPSRNRMTERRFVRCQYVRNNLKLLSHSRAKAINFKHCQATSYTVPTFPFHPSPSTYPLLCDQYGSASS